jgi:Sel1 repeat
MNFLPFPRAARAALALLCLAWIANPAYARAQAVAPAPDAADASTDSIPPDDPTPRADSVAAAAEAGDANAQFEYAMLYQTGAEGLHVNYNAAADWFRRAAEQGHVDAMLSLSTLLLNVDPSATMDWVRRAAELGSPEAQWRAGQVLSGRVPLGGVQTNQDEAMDWYRRAADQRYAGAEEALADTYTEQDDPSRYADALDLYRRAQEDGPSAWAVLRLGMMYAAGEGVEADDQTARQWLSLLGSEVQLNPDYFNDEDLEVLGGLQSFYGLDFTGGSAEPNAAVAAESFRLALESAETLIHPSFARTAQALLQKLPPQP